MLTHLVSILMLGVLCGAWVLFQRWLKRVDPNGRHIESGCGGCGSGHCQRPDPAPEEHAPAPRHSDAP